MSDDQRVKVQERCRCEWTPNMNKRWDAVMENLNGLEAMAELFQQGRRSGTGGNSQVREGD